MNHRFRNILFIFSVILLFILGHVNAEDDHDGDIEDLDYEIWDLMDSAVKNFGPGLTWYELLEVSESATEQEIGKVYRRLSRKYHPDKNPDKKAPAQFQTLAGIAKILKGGKSRRKYNFWLERGVPYWRGNGYYFRKSESLTILQSVLVIILFVSSMQYALIMVSFYQIRSGLAVLTARRLLLSHAKSSKKRQSSGAGSGKGVSGIFDDANAIKALDWLLIEHEITQEMVLDSTYWKELVDEEFGGDEKKCTIAFPTPWNTVLVKSPIWLVGKVCGLFRSGTIKKEE